MAGTPNPLHSWFLGPKGENEQLLRELLDSALASHLDWRRSYHPEDPSPVAAGRRTTVAVRQRAELKVEFASLLQKLHGSVPFFHGRYNGHMLSEQTIAAQAAYFAAMLYDPNNVSGEVAPVTTRLESEVAVQLAEMIGYDPAKCWGHLTSGGTIANFEALWIARNILYHPVAARLAAKILGIDISVSLPDHTRASLADLELWQLLNIEPAASMDLWEKLWLAAPGPVIERTLQARSLATLGYQDYSLQLRAEFGDALPPGVVLATGASHYSWAKIVAALGIGSNQLLFVPVNAACRMDPDALWETIKSLAKKRVPIMACVSACGTTEEGAIDDLRAIIDVRSRAEWELGVTFHIHSDACYGGYAASLTRAPSGARHTPDEVRDAYGGDPGWPSNQWVASVAALADADSVSIDPHKLGYVPYPAGAFLLKDRRGRELVATDPPYLAVDHGRQEEQPVIGRFIFEGSKPGASAAAVWLSHKTIPLDSEAHGRIVASTMRAARRLYDRLGSEEVAPFQVFRLTEPDLNIVCFVFQHHSLQSLEETNALNEAIYSALSPSVDMQAPYVITRTTLTSPTYDGVIEPLLGSLGAGAPGYRACSADGITVLRTTVMNPFSEEGEPDHLKGLALAMRDAAIRFIRNRGANAGTREPASRSYSASSPILSAKST